MEHILDFTALKKNLKKETSGFKVLRIAVLGDSATQLLVQAIRGYGIEEEIRLECFEADFDQIERQTLDLSSDLYKFGPEFVLIFHSSFKFINELYSSGERDRESFAEAALGRVRNICDALNSRLSCRIILSNLPEVDENVFGNYSNKVKSSASYQLREYNFGLMNVCRDYGNLFINDISMLQNRYGESFVFDPRMHYDASMVYSIDFLPALAKNSIDIIKAVSGVVKKCLVLDLDNILWGGVVGDDGLENLELGDLGLGRAFTEFQLWIKQLRQRGVILAACSKNEESIAKEVFEKHPEMILTLDDFAVFTANWNSKVDNIRYIQSILNISLDSMVFCDDNPVERELVRRFVEGITVPDMPDDPAEYLPYLRSLNLFETASGSRDDAERTRMYQLEAQRREVRRGFKNEEEFLESLEMAASSRPGDPFNIPRIAQLTQRSNQFNLRSIRYTEEEVTRISLNEDYHSFVFTLRDKFGDHGTICAVILKREEKTLFIDTWVMSCRVFNRSMEYFVLNALARFCRENGYERLSGEYLPSAKNVLVRDLYPSLGFIPEGNRWRLDIGSYNDKECCIAEAEGRTDG